MISTQRTILLFLLPAVAGMASGCHFISALASPAASEMKVPAETNLIQRSEKKIVIFVESTRSVSAPELNTQLAAAIKAELIKKASIQSGYLFVSGEASPGRANTTIDFRLLSPSQIAKELNAGTILYVRIEEYEMTQLHRPRYFTGSLVTRSMIYDDAGNLLWPNESSGKLIRTRDEIEITGSETSRKNLIGATTHCICRYMYDCPKPDFKTKYEEIDYTKDENWE